MNTLIGLAVGDVAQGCLGTAETIMRSAHCVFSRFFFEILQNVICKRDTGSWATLIQVMAESEQFKARYQLELIANWQSHWFVRKRSPHHQIYFYISDTQQ